MTPCIAVFALEPGLVSELQGAGFDCLVDPEPELAVKRAEVALAGFHIDPDRAGTWTDAVHKSHVDLPIIAVVSKASQISAARQKGAIDVCRTPVRLEILGGRVLAHIKAHRNHRELLAHQVREMRESSHTQQATIELAKGKEFLEHIIHATPDPVVAADLNGRLLLFSRAAEQVLGYSQAEARDSLGWAELFSDGREARAIAERLQLDEGATVSEQRSRLRARNGEQIPVLVTAALVNDNSGQPIGIAAIFRDQRESDSLNRQLQAATNQLIAAEKRSVAQSMAAGAAHTINQPLFVAMGCVEVALLDPSLGEGLKSRLQQAYEHLESIDERVRDMARGDPNRTVEYVGTMEMIDFTPSTD